MSGIARPMRRCSHPGCTQPATHHARCEHHHTQHNQRDITRLHQSQTSIERTKKYGPGWREQRARIIRRDGGCAYCGSNGGTSPLEVHHLTTSTRPRDRELVTLCRRHHRAVEAEIKRGEAGKVGLRIAQWMEGQ